MLKDINATRPLYERLAAQTFEREAPKKGAPRHTKER